MLSTHPGQTLLLFHVNLSYTPVECALLICITHGPQKTFANPHLWLSDDYYDSQLNQTKMEDIHWIYVIVVKKVEHYTEDTWYKNVKLSYTYLL